MSTLLASLEKALAADNRPILFDNDTWHTTSELRRDVLHVVSTLYEAGLRERDEVLIGLPNSYEFAVVYLALLQSGVVISQSTQKMPAAELERCCRGCRRRPFSYSLRSTRHGKVFSKPVGFRVRPRLRHPTARWSRLC